jgi:hypothetical protein
LGAPAAHGLHPARPARRLRPGGAKAGERPVLLDILADDDLLRAAGQVVIGDKSFYGRDLGDEFARARIVLLGLARNTLKGQLDLERHGGRTVDGVTVRILQRILALTAAIWHNDTTGQAVMRSLVAYDH